MVLNEVAALAIGLQRVSGVCVAHTITVFLAFQYPTPIVIRRPPALKHIITLLVGFHVTDTVLLFFKKHCDYFNQSESQPFTLKR